MLHAATVLNDACQNDPTLHTIPLPRSAAGDAGGEKVAGHRENLSDGHPLCHRADCRERQHCRERKHLHFREHIQCGGADLHPADAVQLRLPEMVGGGGDQGVPRRISQHPGR